VLFDESNEAHILPQAHRGADRSSSPRRRGDEITIADIALVRCNKTNRRLAIKTLGLNKTTGNAAMTVRAKRPAR
jgi:hypothetical protein